jgi:hypothetical protein
MIAEAAEAVQSCPGYTVEAKYYTIIHPAVWLIYMIITTQALRVYALVTYQFDGRGIDRHAAYVNG